MVKLKPSTDRCEANTHDLYGQWGKYVVTSEHYALDDKDEAFKGHNWLVHTCRYCGERWYTLIKE